MEFMYQDSHRANIANRALQTVLDVYKATENIALTHRMRNHIDETIKIIITEALRESNRESLASHERIPF
jgi:hypothetical protein